MRDAVLQELPRRNGTGRADFLLLAQKAPRRSALRRLRRDFRPRAYSLFFTPPAPPAHCLRIILLSVKGTDYARGHR